MFRFKQHSRCRQPDSLIHNFEGLTAAEDHDERLKWLTQDYSEPFFSQLKTRLTLLELYQDYFPCEWQRSHADTRLLDLGLHTPRELEFMDLLSESRFPCERDSMEFEDLSVFPLVPDWGEIEWEEMDCLVHVFAGLTGYTGWQDVINLYGLQESNIETPQPCEKVTLKNLEKQCQKVESPLRSLNKAFQIIEYSTGNCWLNSNAFEPTVLEWHRDTIELLTHEYNVAKDWLQEFNALNDWLYTKPERLKQLVELWNAACADRSVEQLEIPFVTTISSDQFTTGEYMREVRETRRHYQQLVCD